MKRGLIAIIILALIIVISLTLTNVITDKAQALTALTKQVYSGTKQPQVLVDEWKKQSNWFSLFINHNRLEPISSKINELEYISPEDRIENCAQIIAGLQEISDHVSLSLYTVF